MNSNLEKILRQRQADKECIICGTEIINKTPSIILQHFILGPVEICEKHVKQSGNEYKSSER